MAGPTYPEFTLYTTNQTIAVNAQAVAYIVSTQDNATTVLVIGGDTQITVVGSYAATLALLRS